MRRYVQLLAKFQPKYRFTRPLTNRSREPVISIKNATFYRQHPISVAEDRRTNTVIFPDLNFELSSSSLDHQYWAIIGPSSAGKTTFFEVLRGQHLCFPPTARSFPYLSSEEILRKNQRFRNPAHAIQCVGFTGKYGGGLRSGNTTGAYLSARYESRREETDFSVLDYLLGNVELNASHVGSVGYPRDRHFKKIIADLRLEDLIHMPVGNLSNGQTRRAKIAKALLNKPKVLLLDEPFIGLDPLNLKTLPSLLYRIAEAHGPRILLSLRPQDPLPDWITHLIHLGPDLRIAHQGPKEAVYRSLGQPILIGMTSRMAEAEGSLQRLSREGLPLHESHPPPMGEPVVEMSDVRVCYGEKVVLGNWNETMNGETRHGLNWTVRRGERWGVFGPNGSGKTTLISLICSDHPQSYSLPIRLFSRPRLPQPGIPGISIFDLQSRIGHSSPEIHNFFPKHLSLRRSLESAWSDTFLSPPRLNAERSRLVDAYLRWFEADLNPAWKQSLHHNSNNNDTSLNSSLLRITTTWATTLPFSSLPFSAQRLTLFLRALIKTPDLVVLDEAFSGMDAQLRDKCLLFLTWGTMKRFGGSDPATGKPQILATAPEEEEEMLMGGRVEGLGSEQALICVSHVEEEVPGLVRDWICLPEAEGGGRARVGRWEGPLEGVQGGWDAVWSGG
ncbi:MAG: hypothetical protein Q9220_007363 [cf. Caloplaca sp. 1 TL-2023]